jgi:hypothetical protein
VIERRTIGAAIQPLKGVPFDYGGGRTSSVKAKPLVVGHVYEVGMESSGSGYGSGWFRMTRDGHIENWRSEPTPAILNAQGYHVTVGEQVPPSPNG